MLERERYQPRYEREPSSDRYGQQRSYQSRYASNQDEFDQSQGATTFIGKLKELGPAFRKLNRYIERSFPNTGDEIANRLIKLTPKAIAVSYLLLVVGIVASRLELLWAEGYLWGIASLAAAMIGVFLWIWSSTIMILPDLTAEARAALKRSMRVQASSFVVSFLTIVYFIGMAFQWW